jgi:hypothetical protein
MKVRILLLAGGLLLLGVVGCRKGNDAKSGASHWSASQPASQATSQPASKAVESQPGSAD